MRNITTVRKPKSELKHLTAVILAEQKNEKLKESASTLICSDGLSVLENQVKNIRLAHPNCDIVVVTGYSPEDVYRIKDINVRYVESPQYDTFGCTKSIGLAMRASYFDHVLIVNGAVLFNHCAVPKDAISALTVDVKNQISNDKVGLVVDNTHVSSICYALEPKWAQISYFCGKELDLLRKIACHKNNTQNLMFETLAKILELGGRFHAYSNSDIELLDINTNKDIEKVSKWIH